MGKTHCYIDIIKNNKSKKFIIAVPTNILKHEVYEKLKEAGVYDVVETKSMQELENLATDMGKEIKRLNALGAYNDVLRFVKVYSKEKNLPYLLEYIKPLNEYGNDNPRIIVTTHKKFLNAKEEFLRDYEVIIDEDILLSSAKNSVEVKLDDIYKLKKYIKAKKVIKQSSGEYIRAKPVDTYISIKEMEQNGITSNVNAFMKSTAIYKESNKLYCFIPTKLCNIKHIILSATANEEIYRHYFNDRSINFVTCKEARYEGRLIQDVSRSYSRRDLDSEPDLIDNIIKENDDFDYYITFMKYNDKLKNQKIHFGNTEGCDFMKGKNIVVIGTPHLSEFVYKLLALHMGIDIEDKMRFKEVEDKSFKYWIHTYTNTTLQTIQLWFLKTELIQAVGRARLLRFDCTVKLYASLPLEQAEIE